MRGRVILFLIMFTTAIIFMSLGSSFAGETGLPVSRERALEIVQASFPGVSLEGGQTSTQLMDDPKLGQRVWYIIFHRQVGDDELGFMASVGADTGEVLSFHRFGKLGAGYGKVLSKEESRQIAENLARRLQPDKFKNTRYIEPDYNLLNEHKLLDRHDFYWARTANGIIVDNQGIGVTVDALSGNVISYYCQWGQNLVFPDTAGVMSAEEYFQKLMAEVGMVLTYDRGPGDITRNSRAILAYQLNSRGPVIIDAVTGDFLDYRGKTLTPKDLKIYEGIPGSPAGKTDKIQQGLSIEDPSKYIEKARTYFRALGYQGEIVQEKDDIYLFSSGTNFTFHVKDESGSPSYKNFLHMSSGPTGISIFFNNVSLFERRQEGAPVSREEALKIAWKFIRQVEPELAASLVLEKERPYKVGDQSVHSFYFYRTVNGIPVNLNTISIKLARDGKINEFNCHWYPMSFPSYGVKVSSSEAARIWLKSTPLKLKYLISQDTTGGQGSNPRLVFADEKPQQVKYIDAYTGEVLISQFGSSFRQGGTPQYNFTGSWAAPQLELLSKIGMLPRSGQFNPSSVVTRRDGLRLILAASGSKHFSGRWVNPYQDIKAGDPDYNIIQEAGIKGIIEKEENFRPGDVLTRATLASWMVNCMGHRDITGITNKVNSPFKDIKELSLKDQNCIGLANGLGLLSGDESGNFRPGSGVTWEELSAAVFKLYANLREPITLH